MDANLTASRCYASSITQDTGLASKNMESLAFHVRNTPPLDGSYIDKNNDTILIQHIPMRTKPTLWETVTGTMFTAKNQNSTASLAGHLSQKKNNIKHSPKPR